MDQWGGLLLSEDYPENFDMDKSNKSLLMGKAGKMGWLEGWVVLRLYLSSVSTSGSQLLEEYIYLYLEIFLFSQFR